jgi:hypothetical protein
MATARESRRYTLGTAGLLLALAVAMLAPSPSGAKPHGGSKPVHWEQVAADFFVSQPNSIESNIRVSCPPGEYPYGAGGWDPQLPNDGEHVYPLGFERQGAQKAVHIPSILFDPTLPATPHHVTAQAVCGPKPFKLTPVQNIIQVNPGQTQTVISTCPPGRFLIGGNYARTYFTPAGGDFAAQAEADIPTNSFIVTATAFGSFGGPVTDTAFCAKTRSYTGTASGPVTIAPHSSATATTPSCPAGNRVVFGGFDTNPHGAILFAGSAFNPTQSYSALGYNRSASPATIEDYAYCLAKNAFKRVPGHH